MTDQREEPDNDLQQQSSQLPPSGELDAASKSLFEALRVSFIILNIIMLLLVAVFLASGFRRVDSNEQAIVLRFGEIRGEGEKRILGPGLYWLFPYPIEQIIKIPVGKAIDLPIDSFWYYQHPSELLGQTPQRPIQPPEKLNPIREGYCLTRGEKQSWADTDGSDYNIVHSKWQLTYRIDDLERFYRNVYVKDIKPGEITIDVIKESITPLLQTLVEDAVVTATVHYTIDEVLLEKRGTLIDHVKRLVKQKLEEIESGIGVISIQLEVSWPRQVHNAFVASVQASQTSRTAITEARSYAENTLNETAGRVADRLLKALYDENTSEEETEALWAQVGGASQQKIAQARAYRTKTVEYAKANAEYLKRLLPEYRKRPDLVIQEIYRDAIVRILDNADEKMIIQPNGQIRILLNRDPAIKEQKPEK